jgi:hypothetical protein
MEMKTAIMTCCAVLSFLSTPAYGETRPIDFPLATQYFNEAQKTCKRDNGRLWGVSLCGPILLADRNSRFVVANRPDKEGILTKKGGMYLGFMPSSVNIANTSCIWAGVKWTMLIWPLPDDPFERRNLMLHEMWHSIQEELGFPATNPSNDHLDTLEGRLWLQLEWCALRRALETQSEDQGRVVLDALIFRNYRRRLFPKAIVQERALEMHEGLAEYTGLCLSGRSPGETNEHLFKKIDNGVRKPSLVRSFAYVSGPIYGTILDRMDSNWRKGIDGEKDLGRLLQKAYSLRMPKELERAAEQRAKKYGKDTILAQETTRRKKIQETVSLYRSKLVDGPVLILPNYKMNVSFNPNELQPLGELGTIYPTARVVAQRGTLEVKKGLLIVKDWSKAIVAAPSNLTSIPLRGDGWILNLADGFQLKAANRLGDYILVEKK